ncbi:BMP family ABC transporter substrate-binding protein [Olsenella sp. Marseille-QA0557]|uniref:BMP family ABC transporter substrate-binding protein n=1 Tax=Olsenella sp. Marseille-QA0557 TaxID=3378782 RepID=UPI003D0A0594
MLEDYRKARKLAYARVQKDVAAGQYPYPPALDDILKGEGYQAEVPIGLSEIDISLIAGTKTRGRQNSFSSNFMPLPESSSEFAMKWSDLIDSQRAEGIREPIVVFEFMQRFYVQEGNKRVSVLRYLKQPTILATITRVLPMPSDSPAYRVYQEFTRFYQVAPIYGIVFSNEGDYLQLAALLGENLDQKWPAEKVQMLKNSFDAFAQSFNRRGGDMLGLSVGDAFLTFLKVYGFETTSKLLPKEIDERVGRLWEEFEVVRDGGKVAYLEDPAEFRGNIIPELKNLYKDAVLAKPFRMAFMYEHSPQTDGWCLLHERGRKKLEKRLGPTISTRAYDDCLDYDDFKLAVEDALKQGVDLIVTISPTQMRACLRQALAHPQCAFINCSVSLSHSAVRTFSGRLYEAKYLLGALAATQAVNHRIGYVADSPVYGSVAEINAFALGAQMVDPHAVVFLKWFSAKDYDWKRELAESDVRVISARDYADPLNPDEPWGLYRIEDDDTCVRLGNPIWKWARYYELIVRSIRNETWRKEGSRRVGEALNYWWGMSAGILDVHLEDVVAYGQRVLVEGLRQSMLTGRANPFAGELHSQGGIVQSGKAGHLTSEEIVHMSWLNENVIGRLPEQRELSFDSLKQVEVSGLIPLDPATLPYKDILT